MGKQIVLETRNLVWEIRRNAWTQEDWENFKEECKIDAEDSNLSEEGRHYHSQKYLLVKGIEWEEVVEMFESPTCTGPSVTIHGKYSDYDISLYEVIADAIREENWDCDICDCDSADETDEDFSIEPTDEIGECECNVDGDK